MSEDIKINRQAPAPAYTPAAAPAPVQSASKMPWIILALVVIVVVVLGVLFRDKMFGSKDGAKTATAGKASAYQAVFLTNGQVYFGKMTESDNDYATLKEGSIIEKGTYEDLIKRTDSVFSQLYNLQVDKRRPS
jgi:hypothetical protein